MDQRTNGDRRSDRTEVFDISQIPEPTGGSLVDDQVLETDHVPRDATELNPKALGPTLREGDS